MIRRVIAALRDSTPTARRLAELERELLLVRGQIDFVARRGRGDVRLVALPIRADDAAVYGAAGDGAVVEAFPPSAPELALPRPRAGAEAVDRSRAGV